MKTQISSFLKERQDRFKPDEANKLNLKRLQKIDFSGEMHFLENKKTNTNMILIKPGDLVISGINVEKGAVGVYQGDEDLLATIHYSSYEFDKNKIDIDYFKWFLKSDAFRKAVQSQTRGGIKTELKPKKFLPLEIDLPDIKEQKQILSKINKVEGEISYLGGNITHDKKLLTKLKQSILSEAVQGKLVPQNPKDEPASELLKKIKKEKEKLIKEGKIKKQKELPVISEDEMPYDLPEGWVWTRFGEIAQHNSGKTLDKGRNKGDLRKYITTSNLYWGYFELDNLRQMPIEKKEMEKCSATKGDLLIIEGGEAGRASVWEEDYDVCFQNHIHRARFFAGISPYYLFRFFEKINITGEINNYRQGVAISNMSGKSLSSIMVPLPPLSEQKRIVEKVDALMALCDELELRIKENKGSGESLMGAVLREVFENEI